MRRRELFGVFGRRPRGRWRPVRSRAAGRPLVRGMVRRIRPDDPAIRSRPQCLPRCIARTGLEFGRPQHSTRTPLHHRHQPAPCSRGRTGRTQPGSHRDGHGRRSWRRRIGRPRPSRLCSCQVTDPVSDGFVASLARPGGNVTGFTIFEHSFAGKWLEMLKEVVPTLMRVAVMQNPDHPAWNAYQRAIRDVASGAHGRRSGADAGD